ncbi:MAG: hypothetical protein K0R65_693 [Crocinitomicaceae bacterium]|jgi:hypothetical protein|nr:hypothetical protein [Crocinitomicaceae bacterium]
MKNTALILSFFLVLASCSSSEKCEECELENANDTIVKDTISSLDDALKAEKVETKSKEQQENLQKIEKKYGEQWDFCTCVVANDSINNAFEKSPSDKQAEKLMARWEHVELKCKEFLTQPNTTPEERAIHEKKVRKCLKNR